MMTTAKAASHHDANQKSNPPDMAWLSRDKEKDRFYLLPGMGGRALRRKKMVMLAWALAAGLIVSLGITAVFYWMNSLGPSIH